MSLKWNWGIAAFYHKTQLVQCGFGTPVVKQPRDRPCDGARHVKNAQLKPMHGMMKKSSLLQLSYEAAPAGRSFGAEPNRFQLISQDLLFIGCLLTGGPLLCILHAWIICISSLWQLLHTFRLHVSFKVSSHLEKNTLWDWFSDLPSNISAVPEEEWEEGWSLVTLFADFNMQEWFWFWCRILVVTINKVAWEVVLRIVQFVIYWVIVSFIHTDKNPFGPRGIAWKLSAYSKHIFYRPWNDWALLVSSPCLWPKEITLFNIIYIYKIWYMI